MITESLLGFFLVRVVNSVVTVKSSRRGSEKKVLYFSRMLRYTILILNVTASGRSKQADGAICQYFKSPPPCTKILAQYTVGRKLPF